MLRDAGPRLHPACAQALARTSILHAAVVEVRKRGGDPTFINALVNGEVAPMD
jgi:hypothetical protein